MVKLKVGTELIWTSLFASDKSGYFLGHLSSLPDVHDVCECPYVCVCVTFIAHLIRY